MRASPAVRVGIVGAGVAAPTLEAIVWTSIVNAVDDGGGTIRKTAGGTAWNAGGISTKAIQSGDGYVEGALHDINGYVHFGLSNGDTGQGFDDVDYAVNTFPAGSIRAFRNGVLKTVIGTVVATDVLRVAVESDVVVIRKNGSLMYTFTADPPTYPLLIDCSLNIQITSRINSCKIQGVLS